jgi:hypothetical protein
MAKRPWRYSAIAIKNETATVKNVKNKKRDLLQAHGS